MNFGLKPLDQDHDKMELCSVGGLSEHSLGKINNPGRDYANSFDKGFKINDILRPGDLKSLDSFEGMEDNYFGKSPFINDKSPSISPMN